MTLEVVGANGKLLQRAGIVASSFALYAKQATKRGI